MTYAYYVCVIENLIAGEKAVDLMQDDDLPTRKLKVCVLSSILSINLLFET